jgi:hypothetical protein
MGRYALCASVALLCLHEICSFKWFPALPLSPTCSSVTYTNKICIYKQSNAHTLYNGYARERVDDAVTQITGDNNIDIINSIREQYGIKPEIFRRVLRTKRNNNRHRFKRSDQNNITYLKDRLENYENIQKEILLSKSKRTMDKNFEKERDEERELIDIEKLESDLWAYYGRKKPERSNRPPPNPYDVIKQKAKNSSNFIMEDDNANAIMNESYERVRSVLNEKFTDASRIGVRNKEINKLKKKIDVISEANKEKIENMHDYRLRKPSEELNLNKKKDRIELHELLHTKQLRTRARLRIENAFQPYTILSTLNQTILSEDYMKSIPYNQSIYSSMSFNQLGIENPLILSNLHSMNCHIPTKIQELTLKTLRVDPKQNSDSPHVALNSIIQSHTGSGKTIAYILPLLKFINISVSKVLYQVYHYVIIYLSCRFNL